ncbi:hypothetical protein KIN20_012087 [Parelaphostrongylus tenuis]|uniref:Uncharacterized protein n=1 Tax=Parelaphostrongylus tenuis TaxID=148309 RepID=A0AAD5MBP2_PARTN|nr:hypothetical protein KIN20_012087 [Parelaphostrongylus tenuis]
MDRENQRIAESDLHKTGMEAADIVRITDFNPSLQSRERFKSLEGSRTVLEKVV